MAAKLQVVSTCFHLLLLVLLLVFPRYGVSQSIVRYLPGFDGPLPFYMETGYVNIDGSDDIQLFYYFFKSESNPVDDPLVVWFTGGPGCSGLSAILFENGPVKLKVVEYNGSVPTLELNPYSWTKVSNILYIDAPVGTGFSYSRTIQASYADDIISAQQGYLFIRKWLIGHTEFLSNPLYIGGDSYSGEVVPGVVLDTSNGIEAGDKPLINLKGYLLGNPITHRDQERNYGVPFSHGMGLISDELVESLEKNCGGDYINEDPSNVECNKALQDYLQCVDGVPTGHVLKTKCKEVTPEFERNIIFSPIPDPDLPCKSGATIKDRRSLEDTMSNIILSPPPFPGSECSYTYGYMLSFYWANNDRVQQALKIRKGKTKTWRRCRGCDINYSFNVKNSVGHHWRISRKERYRSLIYNGDHDLVVPFLSTQAWIRSLNYSISDDWRPWFVESQVAGYARTYTNNMTFATVKGSGHLALEFNPKECLVMLQRWLSYEPL